MAPCNYILAIGLSEKKNIYGGEILRYRRKEARRRFRARRTNGKYIYIKIIAAVRLGGLAPARPIIQRTMQMKGVVSAVIGLTSRMLEHYGASVSEVADNTEARSQ